LQSGQTSQRDAVMILGRYTLCGEIAAGGMAAVYFARMEGTGGFAKSVAVKRLHPQFATDPDFRTMILDEARLAARIRHPNVVSPIDVIDMEDEVLLAMEYVHGQALSRLIRASVAKGEKVPLAICASIMAGMLHGLHAAHEAKDDRGAPLGIVHRDISPHNVIVGADGITRVIDFGIAKAKTSSEATQAGIVKGKLPYLAPEQLDGRQATIETDIYAASLVFWETLVGRRLFEADYDHAIVALILRGRVDPPSLFVDVPKEIDAIVLKGVARDPHARFSSAREMALAIEHVAGLANPSTVGAWVERLAADDLRKRAAKLARLEALPSIPENELSVSLSTSHRGGRTMPNLGMERAPPPLSQRGSGPPPRVPPSVPAPPAPPPRPSYANAPPPPPPRPAPAPPPPRSTPATRMSPTDGPRPPLLRGPDIQMANVGWLPPNATVGEVRAETVRARRAPFGLFLVVFLLVALAGLALLLPGFLRDGYVKEASKLGVTLAIAKVSIAPRSLALEGVSGSIAEVPGVTFKAPRVVLDLRGLDVVAVTLEHLEIEATGPYSDVDLAFEHWVKQTAMPAKIPPGGLLTKVTITDAKVTWKGAFGAGTFATFENVNGTFDGETESPWPLHYTLGAAIVKAGSDKTVFGPYELRASREIEARSLTLKLDPYGSTGAEIGMNTDASKKRTMAFRVPRRSLGELHVPEGLFGGLASKDTRVELTGDLVFAQDPKPHAEGKLTLAATALRMGPGGAPMDGQIDAVLVGTGEGLLEVAQGSTWTLGAVRTKLYGNVDLRAKGFRADVASKRCDVATEGPQGTSRLMVPSVDVLGGLLYVAPCYAPARK
jgi:eukaryotic-like serine/threonine-protein kinase